MDFSYILSILLLLLACSDCHENVKRGKPRTITGSKNWDGALKAFRETVVRVFLHSPALKGLAMGHPIGIASVWLLYIIEASQNKGLSTWEQLGDKVNQRISEKLDDNNIQNLRSTFNVITYHMARAQHGKDEKFSKEDLSKIRAYSASVFPQTYSSGKYTEAWPNVIMKYLNILVAGYLDAMKQGLYSECAWANELTRLRPQILGAAKKLAKSRYQALEKVNWYGGEFYFKPWARLSFRDAPTGVTYGGVPITEVPERVLDVLEKDTRSFLKKSLVDPFNLLYNENFFGDGCNVPAKITENELEVALPKNCMDKEGKCVLPCGLFSMNYRWCVISLDQGNEWYCWGRKCILTCEEPNWDECMPTLDNTLINWRAEDFDKKMKIIKKDM